MRRVLAILVVALFLAPGLFWRDPPSEQGKHHEIAVRPLALPTPIEVAPGVTLTGGWQLEGVGDDFGGYSALVRERDGTLLLFSDRGRYLRVESPEGGLTAAAASGAVGGANSSDKRRFDIEAAARDPTRGTIWLAYENSNAVRRYTSDLGEFDEVRPSEMRAWPSNSGPEAIVRLADGRFIVLSEALTGWERPAAHGLLFAGDPVGGAVPEPFHFIPPDGFRPTDMAALPDGRVVILLRRLQLWLPPRLTSRLVVADPDTIVPGGGWAWTPLAEIAAPLPAENYEGLAVEPLAPGEVRLWLVSDDNSAVLQRTLLLALEWTMPQTEKARRSARPSM